MQFNAARVAHAEPTAEISSNRRVGLAATSDWSGALRQDLIRSVLLFRQPFEGFVGKQTSNERVDDLLQPKHE